MPAQFPSRSLAVQRSPAASPARRYGYYVPSLDWDTTPHRFTQGRRGCLCQRLWQRCAWGLAASLFFLLLPLRAAASDVSPHESLADADLRCLQFVDPRHGWAVGDRGTIWHTNDGGQSWRLQPSGVACPLESVWFVDPRRGWAAGGASIPYSAESQGIVLQTFDGGQSWTPATSLPLPHIVHVHFHDPARGWFLGMASSLCPSGLWNTTDGGRRWNAIHAANPVIGWSCGAFPSADHAALITLDGRFALAVGETLRQDAAPAAPRPVRAMGLARGEQPVLWLAGEAGLVMASFDGGESWHEPESLPAEARGVDFRAVECLGSHVWIAGAPGTRILHSSDDGLSWEWLATGHRLPIGAICFLDAQHGWLAGSLGTILATADGGRTWTVQKQGAARLAWWGVFADVGDIPLELIAQWGAAEGRLGGVHLVAGNSGRDVFPSTRVRRGLEAARLAGATVSDRMALVSAADTVVTTSSWIAGGGRDRPIASGSGTPPTRQLVEHLVRQIRQWQPDVVLTSARESSPYQSGQGVLCQAVLEAVREAADPSRHVHQLHNEGLAPWRSSRALGVLEGGDVRSPLGLASDQLNPALGMTLADFAATARGLVDETRQGAPKRINVVVLHDTASSGPRAGNLFAGLDQGAAKMPHRPQSRAHELDVTALRRRVQIRRACAALMAREIDRPGELGALSTEIGQMLAALDAQSAGVLLFQSAQQYFRAGKWAAAADLLELLVERYPLHDVAPATRTWLVQYYSSAEVARVPARVSGPTEEAVGEPVTLDGQAVFRVLGPTAATGTPASLRTVDDERAGRLLRLVERLPAEDPRTLAQPEIQWPLAAWSRRSGRSREAARIVSGVCLIRPADAWRALAEGELWLSAPQGAGPRPVAICRVARRRPFLDGLLDDECWWDEDTEDPAVGEGNSAMPDTAAHFARDAEYLYVAVKCAGGGAPHEGEDGEPRGRDANLGDQDRVEIVLDVDRDAAVGFQLVVDRRGRTWDACWDCPAAWNPTWYVARSALGEGWTVEMAIPWQSLVQGDPQAGEAWGLAVRRLPGNRASVPGIDNGNYGPQPLTTGYIFFE